MPSPNNASRARGRDLERGAARQSRADRHVRGNTQPQRRHHDSTLLQDPHAAADIPSEIVERTRAEPNMAIERRAVDFVHGLAERGLDDRELQDDRGQHEPAIVVGMVPQEIDPPRRARGNGGVDPEHLAKTAQLSHRARAVTSARRANRQRLVPA